jgi:hypothetical protein
MKEFGFLGGGEMSLFEEIGCINPHGIEDIFGGTERGT